MESSANLEIDLAVVGRDDISQVRRRPRTELDPRTAMDAAIAMHEMGDHDSALDLLEPVVRVDDAEVRAEALWLMARSYLAMRRHAHAARCLEWALLDTGTEMRRVALLYDLGATYESAGARAEALACYRRVSRHMPSFRHVRARIRALRD